MKKREEDPKDPLTRKEVKVRRSVLAKLAHKAMIATVPLQNYMEKVLTDHSKIK